jgi:hypothetical protein
MSERRKDVPARVVIKEYVDVAGAFFARDAAGMINAVLDTPARQFRAEGAGSRRELIVRAVMRALDARIQAPGFAKSAPGYADQVRV